MLTDAKDGLNPALESLRSLSLTGFRGRYSGDNPRLEDFDINNVYRTSTEAISAARFESLPIRGGLHLSVAGGLDTPLAQVATVQPDLSILCDVNMFAMRMIDTRLRLLAKARDGRSYWELFRWALAEDPLLTPSLEEPNYCFTDYLGDGWSSFERFPAVKKAWEKGAIKVIHSDILTDGIQTGMQIAKETGLPIRLINLSNILDHSVNRVRLGGFQLDLREGLRNGTIDPESQVVTASTRDNLSHKIWHAKEFADPRKSLI